MSAETQKKRISSFIASEWNRLVGYVRAWIEDTADRDAEDIVQDVLQRFLERPETADPIADVSAYLYSSLRNRVIDLYRRKQTTAAELATEVSDSRFEASEQMARRTSEKEMFDAIDALPEAQRDVLVATEFEGRAFSDLAEEWDVPLGTLLARKHRAIKALRKALTGGTA